MKRRGNVASFSKSISRKFNKEKKRGEEKGEKKKKRTKTKTQSHKERGLSASGIIEVPLRARRNLEDRVHGGFTA